MFCVRVVQRATMLARACSTQARAALARARHRVGQQQRGFTILSALGRAGAGYNEMLRKHRMVTTTVSGAILGYCGDLVTQSATTMQTEEGYDSRRGLTFTLFGGYITGPLNYMWLGWLDRQVTRLAPLGGLRAVALKVCAQSFIMQPLLCRRRPEPSSSCSSSLVALLILPVSMQVRPELLPLQRAGARLDLRSDGRARQVRLLSDGAHDLGGLDPACDLRLCRAADAPAGLPAGPNLPHPPILLLHLLLLLLLRRRFGGCCGGSLAAAAAAPAPPPEHASLAPQAIFFSGFGLVWNSILSFISNRPAIKEGAAGTLDTLRERADVTLSDVRSVAARMVTNVRDVPDPPRKVHGPSPGSLVGYLMGPGLQ